MEVINRQYALRWGLSKAKACGLGAFENAESQRGTCMCAWRGMRLREKVSGMMLMEQGTEFTRRSKPTVGFCFVGGSRTLCIFLWASRTVPALTLLLIPFFPNRNIDRPPILAYCLGRVGNTGRMLLSYFIILFLILFQGFNQKEAGITVSVRLGYGCRWECVCFSVHDTYSEEPAEQANSDMCLKQYWHFYILTPLLQAKL